jgi:hypothetical protein
MMKASGFLKLLTICAALGFGSSASLAATCTAATDYTNPDASLTNSTACGEGTLNNDTATEVNTAENVLNLTWSFIDKDESGGGTGNLSLQTGGVQGGATSGTWAIDSAGLSSGNFLIVIKDGGTTSPPTTTDWFWFIVDTSIACAVGDVGYVAGAEYCGSWTMYGTSGDPKAISHMSLYGAASSSSSSSSGTPPGSATPEPGTATLALLGMGLIGAGFIARRRRVR